MKFNKKIIILSVLLVSPIAAMAGLVNGYVKNDAPSNLNGFKSRTSHRYQDDNSYDYENLDPITTDLMESDYKDYDPAYSIDFKNYLKNGYGADADYSDPTSFDPTKTLQNENEPSQPWNPLSRQKGKPKPYKVKYY